MTRNQTFKIKSRSKTFEDEPDKFSIKKLLKAIAICSVIVIHADFSKVMYLYDISLFNI